VVAVARKVVFQKRATLEEAVEARDFMLSYEVETYLDDALLKRAYELANQFDRPTAYDAQYLAVAERLNCEFWTADEKLFNAVQQSLNWVKWVGKFEQ
jgi:predicted nucleic acid-binding protein